MIERLLICHRKANNNPVRLIEKASGQSSEFFLSGGIPELKHNIITLDR
jgi:hypothetical protein